MPGLVCNGQDCKEQPKYDIIYDCGPEEQHLILCLKHYNAHTVFKQHVKKIEEIKN